MKINPEINIPFTVNSSRKLIDSDQKEYYEKKN